MKRLVLLSLVFLLVSPTIVLMASPAKIPITFMFPNTPDRITKYTAIFNDVMKRYPNLDITLNLVATTTSGYGWDAISQKFLTSMAAGTPPDILFMGVSWLPQLSAAGYMTPLDNYIEKLNPKEFTPGSLKWLKYLDGKTYFISSGSVMMAMYYNKDMFDAAGLKYPSADAQSAITLDEYFAAAKKLTNGVGPNKKFGVGAELHPERSMTYLWANGGSFLNADMTKCIVNSPEGIQVYQKIVDAILGGYAPDPATLKTISLDNLFTSGKIGMMIASPYQVYSFGAARDQGTGPHFGVAVVPRGKYLHTIDYLDAYGIPSGVKHPAEAFTVLSELIGYDAGMVAAKQALSPELPINLKLAAAERPLLYKPLDTEKEKAVFFNASAYALPFPFNKSWNECMNAALPIFEQMSIKAIGVKDGLNNVAAAVNAVIQQNQ
jgi:multiple sugar transport system substrate-binding protein